MKNKICRISKKYFNDWVSMGMALWPESIKKEIVKEFRELFLSKRHTTFLYKSEKDKPIAFINLSLRVDPVEGATINPVAYIEGIYVAPSYRKQGIGKKLVKAAEEWARKHNCKELGSDTELHNIDSQKFHQNLGFKKVEVIVHFIKKL